SIYRPEWGVASGSLLDTPEACQDLVDHVAPPDYFSELRHLHNDEFLQQYNVNLARQVAIGSELCLRFEQETKLLRKFVAQVARQDKRIQARELEIKNLEALLETEADMKKATEDRSARLSQELEDMRALFSDLQVSNEHLSQQVATLQEQVSGKEKLKAAFKEFKRQVFKDVLSAWITKGMSEGLRHGVEHGQAQLSLESIELKGLKDAPMDVIMAALYLESDTGNDALQHIRDLRLSSSQLTIPVYPEVSNEHLSQQVATLQEQVSGKEKLKAAFKEFKRYEHNRVEQRCAEMDARLDALSIDFDEELYPYMLTAIACRRLVIGRGLRLAVMK
nr:hypothetical protein [Tanacetum cinerariifolium]